MTATFANRYVVERTLGVGGMGAVYLVSDPLAGGRRLALKHLRPDRLSPMVRASLGREFRALTRLRHPNLVEVYDFSLEPVCYFTMEYVEGRELIAARLEEPGLVEAVVQVCRALEYVHSRGLVHLDVKPSNILVSGRDAPTVKLTDFGVASEVRGATPSGYTPGFVAPEVMNGGVVDGRADLFSLGMTLLALAAPSTPVDETTIVARGIGAANSDAAELTEAEVAHLPACLVPVVQRLIRPDPEERFASAAQVIEALAQAVGRPIPVETPATQAGWIGVRLTGRDRELAKLLRAYTDARRGESRYVVVAGAAGLGKSSLVKELRVQVQLDGGLVATASCSRDEPTYAPITTLVAQLVGMLDGERGQPLAARLGTHHAAALERLVRGPGDAGDDELDTLAGTPAASRSRLTEAVVALVTAASTVRQLLVAIEDTQWLDDASAAMLQALAERVAPGDLGRVMLAVTTREDAPAVDVATRLELEPLPPARVRELVEDVVGAGAAPPSFVARAAELSRGNGLYVCELLRLCVDRELIVRRGRGWCCDEDALAAAMLPLSTADLIAARIALLPPSLRRLLWLAAMVGGAIETAVVEALVGAEARAALADLTGRQFLVAEGPAYRFDHVEVQVAALRDLDRVDEGPALHRQVADVLAASGAHPADVARLYLASDEPARALGPLVAAGERAAAVYDYGAAVAHYDAALTLGGPSLAVHARRLAAIRKGGLGGVDARQDEVLALARQSGGDAEREVRLSLALIALQRGGFAEALAHADALGALAGDAPSAARVEAHRIAGLARYNLGDLAGALERLDAAVTGAHALGDAVLEASARNDRGFVHGYAGDHARAVADHEAALAALEQAPRAASLDALAATRNNLGFVCWHLGRYDAARVHLDEALALRRRLADLHGEGVTRNNVANVLRHRGELDDAAAEYHAAIDLCRRSGNVLYEAIALNNLGQIEEERDCFAEAAELYRRALGLVERLGDRIRQGDNLGNLGICALRAGDRDGAHEFLARSVALRRAIGDRAYLVLDLSFLARAHAARGDGGAARAAVDEALGVVAAGQEGIEQIQTVYLNAHLVFDALGEAERAGAALARAGELVRVQAASLDGEARAAFFSRVRVNREIVGCCRAAGLADPSGG